MADTPPPQQNPPSILTDPQTDADRIRLKRLAKLQGQSPSQSASTSASNRSTPVPSGTPPARSSPKSTPAATPRRLFQYDSQAAAAPPRPTVPKAPAAPQKLDPLTWEHDTISRVFNVTLDPQVAQDSSYSVVYLHSLATEIMAENGTSVPPKLSSDLADRLLISRLELSPDSAMTDNDVYRATLAALPKQQTIFEYLTGCWKRIVTTRSRTLRQGYSKEDVGRLTAVLDKLRDLVISYAGLTLQDPSMFSEPPQNKPVGVTELVHPLLSLTSSSPLTSFGSSTSSSTSLDAPDVEPFIQDLATRFDGDGLEDILSGLFRALSNLIRADQAGLGGTGTGDAGGWRSALAGIEALCANKTVAAAMTTLDDWSPRGVTAAYIEHLSLLGPALRLSVFMREWPQIAQTYFTEPEKKTQPDIDSVNNTLRTTLISLQTTLFNIFNSAVRASPTSREAVLNYFATVLRLNVKRGGMQVDPATVASDGYMINLQASLLRLAEPFMDSKFSKIDRIDPLYFAHSERLDVSEETRLKATSEEAIEWEKKEQAKGAAPPNFISDVFYLAAAFNHLGLIRTIQTHNDLEKQIDEIQRHLENVEADRSWVGTPMQARAEQAIAQIKTERTSYHMEIFAYQTQILDGDLTFRNIGFTGFLMTWLVRLVDPAKRHPTVQITLPLPQEVAPEFRMLPEYFIEDALEYYLFLIRHRPQSLELNGKKELLDFVMTFLSSTWYIKNPYLKIKLVQILFYGCLAYGRERLGILGTELNSHPLALKHLMPSLMSFYVEVEQTGTHTQFYDKFDARRNIAYILKTVWNNLEHREKLKETASKLDSFVRFANLLMNDATFLLDESLGKLAEIHTIQQEMASDSWNTRPPAERKERERVLRSTEQQASSYTALGKTTVELLKTFTAETKAPFVTPEVVDRLAAMLNYNLDALVGPKCQNLNVKNMDKYRFNPRQLLSDILQVYLNLADQPEFVKAIAGEGRSYNKSLFERAAGIAHKRSLKSGPELEQLMLFVTKVEEMKLMIDAEDDLGEIPDEYLDPLMATLMRDPVLLPSSKAIVDRSTIKAHLLSVTTDPFNRAPLKLEDVLPATELKEQIDNWIAEKRSQGVSLEVPKVDADNDAMDTDI